MFSDLLLDYYSPIPIWDGSSKKRNLILSYWIRKWNENTKFNSTIKNRWIDSLTQLVEEYCCYTSIDEWDHTKCPNDIIINEKFITKINYNGSKLYHNTSIYGKKTLSEGIHKWKFRLVKIGRNFLDCAIGICMTNKVNTKAPFNGFGFLCGYGKCMNVDRGELIIDFTERSINDKLEEYEMKFGPDCYSGDIITMIVNMDQLSMKILVNNIDYGYAFNKGMLPQSEYRLAVNLIERESKIELLNDGFYKGSNVEYRVELFDD